MAAFLIGATVLVVLGVSGTTAAFVTLALIATAAANAGPLLGSHNAVPILGPVVLWFNWLITPLSFPIIGLAVLFFPSRAEILDRHKWIVPAVLAAAVPMLVISVASAAFLSGVDAALPALAWFGMHGWTFEASFALCLAVNVLIVAEGIKRYRVNLDANERRRIQIVVFTVVPAVFAYALKTGIPLLFGLLGRPVQLPWPIEAFLLAIFLLPAFGLPYAVAVRHVFSPRTVLRRSLQYAFARNTLTALVVIPVVALVASLVQQRDQSLAMIVSGRPLFYLFFLAMLGARVEVSRRRAAVARSNTSSATNTTRARSWCRWRDECPTKPIRGISSRWSSPRSIRRSTRKTSPCSHRIRRRAATPPAPSPRCPRCASTPRPCGPTAA